MISALIFRATGRLVANELMMTGRLISAAEAAAAGLVNKVVPDAEFDDALHQWVADIAGKSPLLLGMGKRALAATRDMPLESALDYLQAQLALAFTTEDLAEGVRAFKEKRSPRGATRDDHTSPRALPFRSDHSMIRRICLRAQPPVGRIPRTEELRDEAKPVHRPLQPARNRPLLPCGAVVHRHVSRPVGPARPSKTPTKCSRPTERDR